MDISRYLLQVGISINDKGFITTLIEMARLLMGAVIIRGVRDIKVAHKFLKVGQRGFDKEMKVVGHQYIGQDIHLVGVARSLQEIEKCCIVGIKREYCLTCIASTGDMVVSILKLDSQGPRHDLHGIP